MAVISSESRERGFKNVKEEEVGVTSLSFLDLPPLLRADWSIESDCSVSTPLIR